MAERVRMAVAELGYDPSEVTTHDDDTRWEVPPEWPTEVVWRAREVACRKADSWTCWECFRASSAAQMAGVAASETWAVMRACQPGLPFTRDCGRDRSHP